MTKWEYVTVPLLVHATKQILDNWGQDGWELVQVVPGPTPENLVAYLKRPTPACRRDGWLILDSACRRSRHPWRSTSRLFGSRISYTPLASCHW